MDITNNIIDELFNNDYFKEKLNEYIISNTVIYQDYDLYRGTYDNISFSFAGNLIEVKKI